jgi:hypothetical protein
MCVIYIVVKFFSAAEKSPAARNAYDIWNAIECDTLELQFLHLFRQILHRTRANLNEN